MFQTVTESLAIGNEVSPQELREIYQKGYRTIVDLCPPAEGTQMNAEEVKQLGFDYRSVPVDKQNIAPEAMPAFLEAVNSASQPIYTRCASGFRAAVMTLRSLASREGWTEEQYRDRWQALGIDYKPNSPVEVYARDYFQNQNS